MKPLPFPAAFLGLVLGCGFGVPQIAGQDLSNLPPLSPEELAMKDNLASPGAAAMILYYAVDTDNTKSSETHAVRLKIFREEGKKYANIEIPYFNKDSHVEDIRARTIAADGKVSELADPIYDREIVKAKKYRVNAKVFTMSNVQAGSIIEYSYRMTLKEKIPDVFRHPEQYLVRTALSYPAARWEVQQDLFVRHAHYTLHKVSGSIRFHAVGFPDKLMQTGADGITRLDLDNIPSFEEEEYSPPEDTLRARVDVYYAAGFFGPDGYWRDVATRRAKEYEPFLKKSKVIEREAERLVAPNDTPEEKLRKIYARVQQIRAVSYEAEKTDKERKQENLAENKNVEEVLARGHAYANQINLLFVALARAAGFDAYPYEVTSRRTALFMEDWPNEYQLNAMVVQVRIGSSLVYLDPATKFCPYGLLPWEESEAGGVRVDSRFPAWGPTPRSSSTDAVTRRKAELRLTEDGALRGNVQVLFFGQEALKERLEALQEDEAARQKKLEESLKNTLPQGANVKLVATQGWESSDDPAKASFEVDVPNFATQAGRRLILPVGIFHVNEANPFFSARRVNPIYFTYPQETYEEVKLELPVGMQLEALPEARKSDQKAVYYEFSASSEGNALRINRTLRFSGYLFDRQQYAALRAFYDRVLAGDSQQATLLPRTEKAAKQP